MVKKTSELKNRILAALDGWWLQEWDEHYSSGFDWNAVIPIAYTDEVPDSEYEYDYAIQCEFDMKRQKDIYSIENGYADFTFIYDSDYENLIENLKYAEFEDWISYFNGIDFDDASDYTNKIRSKEMTPLEVQSQIEHNFRNSGKKVKVKVTYWSDIRAEA